VIEQVAGLRADQEGRTDCVIAVDLDVGGAEGGVEAAGEAGHYLEVGVVVCSEDDVLGLYAFGRR